MRPKISRRVALRRHAIAAAALSLFVGASQQAPAAPPYYDYSGSVYTFPTNLLPFDVNTALLDLSGNTLGVGSNALGSFSALAGATLLADTLIVGDGGSGVGTFSATGPGTLVQLSGSGTRLTIGNWGSGTMDVSGGAVVDATVNLGACAGSGIGCGTTIGGTTGATGTLTITGTGSKVRLDSFNLGQTSVYPGYGVIGGVSTGNLNITAGGSLRSSDTYLGYTAGTLNSGSEKSVANVEVDGSGSQWVITSDAVNKLPARLRIGAGGPQSTADVLVSNGGLLKVDGSAWGANGGHIAIGIVDSKGSLTIRDAGSQLQVIGGSATIQVASAGSFSALAGASVAAGGLTIGSVRNVGGAAAATIDGIGTTIGLSGVNGRLLIGNPGNGSLTVSGGALLDATLNAGACSASGAWCGNLIGGAAGTAANLTVTGAGSQVKMLGTSVGSMWVDSGFGVQGGTSTGTVQVLGGGSLSTQGVTLGGGQGAPGATGNEHSLSTVTINGSDSHWTANADMFAGGAFFNIGEGPRATSTVTVNGGGKLALDASAAPPGSFSSLTIGDNGGQGTLNADTGGSVQVTGSNNAIFVANGSGSTGTFSVRSGAQVGAGLLVVANGSGAVGDATVSDAGSTMLLTGTTYGRLSIGQQGTATVQVLNGGVIDASTSLAGCSAPGAWCGGGINTAAGSIGTLTISGAGSKVLTAGFGVGSNYADVNYGVPGGTSQGTINVLAGGLLGTQAVTLGYWGAGGPASNGNEHVVANVTIDGAGSQWTAGRDMNNGLASFDLGVGPNTQANVTVSRGGALVVDGTGTPAGLQSQLNIGRDGGTGTLNVNTGGIVQLIGTNTFINVASGTGSTGSFNVLSEAQASAGGISVGNGSASAGDLTMSDSGSKMLLTGINGRLTVGGAGAGVTQVLNGGLIDASTNLAACAVPNVWCGSVVGNNAGSNGTLIISGVGSEVRTASLGVGNRYVGDNGWGTPGGISTGVVNVLAGGELKTQNVTFGGSSSGPGALGTEQSFATAVIDGAGSKWISTKDTIWGGNAYFMIGGGPNATAQVTVSNGGQLVLDATGAPANAYKELSVGIFGSNGTLNVSSGGSVQVLNAGLGIGAEDAGSDGTLSITGGATVSSNGGSAVRRGGGPATSTVTIDGPGSGWTITRDLLDDGGQASLSIAPNPNGNALVTISSGGKLSISGSRSNPATDNSIPALRLATAPNSTAIMSVGSGSAVTFSGDTGVLIVGGNSSQASKGATAVLNITGGGAIESTGSNGLTFVVIGRNQATGTVNVDGAGSQLRVAGVGGTNTQGLDGLGGLIEVGRNQGQGGGTGTMNVTGKGSVVISDNGQVASTGSMGLTLAQGAGSTGTVTVSGRDSSIVVTSTGGSTSTTPYVHIGNGGDGKMTISDGGSVSVLGSGQRNFIVSNAGTGSGTLDVNTAGRINASWFAVGNNGGSGTATIDASTVNLDGVFYYKGAAYGASVRVGRGAGANGVLNLHDGAVIDIDNTTAGSSVILGGTSALPGGTGTLNLSGGSAINFTGPAANAQIQVGGVSGTGTMTLTGASTVDVGALGETRIGSTAGSIGNLMVSGGSQWRTGIIAIGGNDESVAGGTGSASFSGAGTELNAYGATGVVGVGFGGNGSLSVANQATLKGILVAAGTGDTGNATIALSHATVALTGEANDPNIAQAGAGVYLGGIGGTGKATIDGGTQVTITNGGSMGANLALGGFPVAGGALGTGTLDVTGGSQIKLVANPGKASATIGHDGTGTATFSNASLLDVSGGQVIIAGQPGSTGTLTVNSNSVVNASYVGVGATPSGPGGNGTLKVNDGGTVNTTTLEIGPHGVLTGDGGIINAAGDVIVDGKIIPGDAPGRITINCNLVANPGSTLEIGIQAAGSGYLVGELVFGSDAKVNLANLNVHFNFIGTTNPNAFEATGRFNLDSFIESQAKDGTISGLSTTFAPGENWGSVLKNSVLTASSDSYLVSPPVLNDSTGSLKVIAVPVPEPQTWALWLGGIVVMAAWMRRRQRALRG